MNNSLFPLWLHAIAVVLTIVTPAQLRGQSGVVVSWGDRTIPLPFYEARRIISVKAGGSQNVALRSDGVVLAWGTVT